MFTDTDVAWVRHVVQRILVPCVFVIGLLGNSVSIYVLTRRRMRCTTNIYLSALAITDIIYLAMALLLSLQHYDYVQRHWEPYWISYRVVMWLCDACAYISIYIAVCFTIERFIAIRYPLKRQTFCTESLAKKVITGVALFCLLATISTAFEHEYSVGTKLIDGAGKPCNLTLANAPTKLLSTPATATATMTRRMTARTRGTPMSQTPTTTSMTLSREAQARTSWPDYNGNAMWLEGSGNGKGQVQEWREEQHTARALLLTAAHNNNNATALLTTTEHVKPLQARSLNIPSITSANYALEQPDLLLEGQLLDSVTPAILHMQMSALERELRQHDKDDDDDYDDDYDNADDHPDEVAYKHNSVGQQPAAFEGGHMQHVSAFNVTEYCQNVTYYRNIPSSLALNALYTRVWSFFTLFVFVLIPLCLLATFNCFLIMLVRRSKNLRGEMTNASSMRRPKRKSHSSSVSQENRVTVTLIAVVLLFILCQLPWAIYLIISEQMDIEPNLQKIIGNIFNFLTAINAAANFFLYCVLSDKYRKTVRELITGYRYRRQRNTLTSASVYNNNSLAASALNGSRRHRQAVIE